ncbi:MAG: pilin [Candidatus Coproplasma sp.]
MEKDIKNYDYLTISVKSAQLKRILDCYYSLGWSEVKCVDDREYYDMKYITLRRPHKIPNKDRLQLLQVRMETSVNTISSVNARKHQRSGITFAVMQILALCLLAVGLWLILGVNVEYADWAGIVSCAAACVFFVISTVIILVARKPEERAAAKKVSDMLNLLYRLITEARSLAGVDSADKDGHPSADPEEGGETALAETQSEESGGITFAEAQTLAETQSEESGETALAESDPEEEALQSECVEDWSETDDLEALDGIYARTKEGANG